MRIDKYLAESGLCESRNKALRLIEAHLVQVNGVTVNKPSYDLPEGAEVVILGSDCPYVSRGGLKLKGALDAFNLDVNGLVCADIGSSTGGFTDCLLQSGAVKVYAVDSGSDQLHRTLRTDPRVIVMEGCNARSLTTELLGEQVDLVVTDVSFISQTLLHRPIASILKDGGIFVSLIKPQFEVGRAGLGKGGIVKSTAYRHMAAENVIASSSSAGLGCRAVIPSPITGGDGNVEYLARFVKGEAIDAQLDINRLP